MTPTSSSASETSASSSETSTQNSESSATSGETSSETSSSASENLSVLKYLVSLYKVDGETSEESLIAFSTLDSSATEKSFSSETSEDYSVANYSIDSATTYKVKLYCIYSISSTSDETSSETSTTTYSVNEVQVKTSTDNSNPDPVSDATMALAEDSSSITLIWTNSADADLASFKITPYIDGTAQDVISLSKADSETNKIDFTASAKNTYTYDLTSSKTDRIFKFTITSYDDAGNPTSLEDENAKYVVSFKTSSDSADSITVAGDTNPPAKVGDLKITIKSISDSNVTYDASWTNPSDSDFDKVLINGEDVGDVISFQNHTVALDDISSGFTVSSVDDAGNENTITVPSELFKNSNFVSASNATVENLYSGYKVTGLTAPTSTVEGNTYTYSINAILDDSIVSSSLYSSGTETVLLRGFTAGTEYTLVAKTEISNTDYTVIYAENSGKTTPKAKTVVWEIHSPWQGNGLIAPYMTSSKTYQNVVQAGYTDTLYSNIEDFTYNAWIVQPALNGDVDSFSLEATVANTGASSGYYMTSGSSSKYSSANWDITGKVSAWSYKASSYAYHAWVTKDFDDEDTDLMSFKKSENTDYATSGYYYITLDKNDYVLWGSAANESFVSKSNIPSDKIEDSAFYTVEHNFDGTSSSPSHVTVDETATTKTASTASFTFTISDSDIASYKVSTTNTKAKGDSIDDVTASSNLGLMGSHTVSYTGLKANTDYTFTIKITNVSGSSTDTIVSVTTDSLDESAYSPTNVTVAPRYTGELLVTWTEDDDIEALGNDITYAVTLTPESGDALTKTEIASGVKKARFHDLTIGTKYTAKVVATYNSKEYEAEEVSAEPEKVVYELVSGFRWQKSNNRCYVVTPSYTSSKQYYDIITDFRTNSTYKNLTYPYWIVYPGLSDPDDDSTISFEAASSDGTGSGMYLYIDPDRTINSSAYNYNHWTWMNTLTNRGYNAFIASLTETEDDSETLRIDDKAEATFIVGETSYTDSSLSSLTGGTFTNVFYSLKVAKKWDGNTYYFGDYMISDNQSTTAPFAESSATASADKTSVTGHSDSSSCDVFSFVKITISE